MTASVVPGRVGQEEDGVTELRHLRYFLAVAEEGAFTRAAARLFVAQPALSRQIGDLERHLGCRLFVRGSRGSELTEAGHRLRAQARRIVDDFDRGVARLREEARRATGHVRLGLNTDLATRVRPVLDRLATLLPDVRVEPVCYGARGAQELMGARSIDAALTWWGEPGPTEQAVELFREKLFVVLPPSHELVSLPSVAAADVGSAGTIAMFDPRFGKRAYASLAHMLRGRFGDPELVSEPMNPGVSAQEQMIGLARRRGIATVVSTANVERLRLGGMVARPLELPTAPITLLWPREPTETVGLVADAVRTLAAAA